jgi:hypothetical protein
MPAATRINQQRAVELDPIAVRRNVLALIHAPENTGNGRIPVRGLLPQHQTGGIDRRSDRGVIGQREFALPYAGGRIADKAATFGHALSPQSFRLALGAGDERAHQVGLRLLE